MLASGATAVYSEMSRQMDAAIRGLRALLVGAKTRRVVVVCDAFQDSVVADQAKSVGLHVHPIRLGAGTQKQGPCLIDVPDEAQQERFVNDSIEMALREATQPAKWDQRKRAVCAWLATDLTLGALGSAIASRSHIVDDTGVVRTFRFWDPRTMQHAMQWQNRHAADCGIAGVAWGFIDSFGAWRVLGPAEASEAWVPPQFQCVQQLGLVNAALQCLTEHGVSVADASGLLDRLRGCLQAGRNAGLSAEDDLIKFAADRVRWNAEIERASVWQKMFKVVRDGQGRYIRTTADYDENDWAAVLNSIPKRDVTDGVRS